MRGEIFLLDLASSWLIMDLGGESLALRESLWYGEVAGAMRLGDMLL